MILTKKQTNDFDDILGVTITTGDEWLDKKLNQNICYGGKVVAVDHSRRSQR